MLVIPQHIKWRINGVDFGDYSQVPISEDPEFYFEYTDLYNGYDPSINFKEAIRNRLTELSDKKLAICVSGIDSELIAREASSIGLNFELFFLSNWGLNDYMLTLAQQLATELNAKLNVVTITKEETFEFVKKYYLEVRVNKPTYLILPMLFAAIPDDFYIICGEGDINKTAAAYPKSISVNTPASKYLTISNTEISYWLWARKNNREGDYYFFSSTKQLILSDWNSPYTIFDCPTVSNRETVKQLWGDKLAFGNKTTNWDTDDGKTTNLRIRSNNQLEYRLDRLMKGLVFYPLEILKYDELT